jgi:hypothetical protein
MSGRFYFNVFADNFQFLVMDAETERPDPDWNAQALANRLVLFDSAAIVATARNMSVPVVVELADRLPVASAENLDTWDHVVECHIDIPSGRLLVVGSSDYYPGAPSIAVIPGIQQVRLFYGGLQTLTEDGLSGSDIYVVMMAPGPVIDLAVLRQAPTA